MDAKKTNLMELCERGATHWVELEIENGAQVNEKDKDDFTALHFACMYGYKDIVELLIKNGAKIKRIQPGSKKNPLMLACENGHKDVAELLIQSGFDVESDKISVPNSLRIACLKGYRSIAELLLRVGYQFNNLKHRESNYSKEKLLLEACSNGHVDIVKLLIEMNTSLKMDTSERSPLHTAINRGFTEIVEIMLENEATPETLKLNSTHISDLAKDAVHDIYIIIRNNVIRNFFKIFSGLDMLIAFPKSLWQWKFVSFYNKFLKHLCDFRWALTTITTKKDFSLGYDQLRNEGILRYFQSEEFLNKLKLKLEFVEMLKEKSKLKISKIGKKKLYFIDQNKHEYDRFFAELKKTDTDSFEYLKDMINLIQDEEIRKFFLKNIYKDLWNIESILTKFANELRQVYDLVTSDRLGALFRSENVIDEVPNEIKTPNSYKRVYRKRSPLIIACENNNIPLVQHLIIRGEYINVRDFDGKTPLMKACFSKHFELAQMLLQLGADVQIEDENGENASFFIQTRDEIEKTGLAYRVFTSLLNTKKIDINKPNKFGETLWFYACNYTQRDIIDFLFDNGVDKKLNAKFVQKLIVYGELKIFKYLFDKGAELSDFHELEKPYVHESYECDSILEKMFIFNWKEEIIPLFYEKGYLKDVCLGKLLHLACESKNFELIKYLVEKGANVNHYDEYGNSALMILAESVRKDMLYDMELLEYFVDNGADINHLNNSGEGVLHYALTWNMMYICEFLIKKGANFYQNGESIFSGADVECQYLFCSGLIRKFYELFQSNDASVLRDKVLKSIDTNEIQYIDYLNAFKLTYENEDQVTNAKELRNDRILEYFSSFDFREKFVIEILINLKDKLELLNSYKNKIETNFPEIKIASMENVNLLKRSVNINEVIILIESFMEKFREYKKLYEVKIKNESETLIQSNENILSFSELEELLLDGNLINNINEVSGDCAKSNKVFIISKKINYYFHEVERILTVSNKLFDFLSQEEVRSFLNLKR